MQRLGTGQNILLVVLAILLIFTCAWSWFGTLVLASKLASTAGLRLALALSFRC
jgi:hypothetical protein